MEHEIKVLLVDDNREALAALNKQMNYANITVVGEAGFGAVAYTWASQLQPDIALVAVEEPVARALQTVEALALGQPRWPVIVISSKTDRESMRKAMRAGADDYVSRSAVAEELRSAIVSLARREREAVGAAGGDRGAMHRTGTIVSVFGSKGGIGKTTLATNLSAGIALESRTRVALVDLDLQFGDVALVMDIRPEKTISDMVESLDKLDADLVEALLATHTTGVRVLPAPLHIDGSEAITGEHVQRILDTLSAAYDYVILDTANNLNETVLAALDMSTLILLVTTPEVPCIKRTKSVLELMKHWQYSDDKVKLVVNKANRRADASPEDIASVLEYPAFWQLPFDQTADAVFRTGGLFVQTKPKANISRSILELSRKVLGIEKKGGLMDRMGFKLPLSRR